MEDPELDALLDDMLNAFEEQQSQFVNPTPEQTQQTGQPEQTAPVVQTTPLASTDKAEQTASVV